MSDWSPRIQKRNIDNYLKKSMLDPIFVKAGIYSLTGDNVAIIMNNPSTTTDIDKPSFHISYENYENDFSDPYKAVLDYAHYWQAKTGLPIQYEYSEFEKLLINDSPYLV